MESADVVRNVTTYGELVAWNGSRTAGMDDDLKRGRR